MVFVAVAMVGRADAAVPRIEAAPGTVVRWTEPGTRSCTMAGRSWPPLQETCYYPIELLHEPGVVRISRRGAGPAVFAEIAVSAYPYGTKDIQIGDIPQANPSAADLRKNARDQAKVGRLWTRKETKARFTLPIGAPAGPRAEGMDFGAKWVFNGKAESAEEHTGLDFAVAAGTPVSAVADGLVVLVDDLFYPGKAVFVDHGGGLISMYFHLSEFKVKVGQAVKKGDTLGLVGDTGRASGPHLHFGVRWHGARVNPEPLLGDPSRIPPVAP